MSERNESDGPGAIIGAGLGIFAIFLCFVGAIASLAFTAICVFAWNGRVTILGKTITPLLARGFLICGGLGAVLVGLFGLLMYGVQALMPRNVIWMPLIGYVAGSLGWLPYYFDNREQLEKEASERRMRGIRARREAAWAELGPLSPPAPARQEPQHAFEFATWDDGERRS